MTQTATLLLFNIYCIMMAKVHLRPDVEIDIPKAAYKYARRLKLHELEEQLTEYRQKIYLSQSKIESYDTLMQEIESEIQVIKNQGV